MAYFSGSVTSITALRQALIDACVSVGWSWDATNQVLSKDALFVRITTTSTDMQLLGRTSSLAGDAPNVVVVGRLCNTAGFPTFDFTWPAEYHIFTFDNPAEVYLVVRYDLDVFQWAGFGKSSIDGLAGSGMWIGATRGSGLALPLASASGIAIFSRNLGGGSTTVNRYICPAWAWSNNIPGSVNADQDRNTYVHSNLDSGGWLIAQSISSPYVGVSAISELLATQPSSWNSEAALLPMRAYKVRPSSRVSLISDFSNARYIRIDNLEPGQLIELGSDSWMVFPWLRKNIAARDGSAAAGATGAINHTGTFGWAIRYEGG